MKIRQGTMSVLFGCHSLVHCFIVFIAWRKLYGQFPNWWEAACIMLHDIGHWGKDYLDNYEQKRHHAELGAKIAGRLFGKKGYDLVFGHNAYNGDRHSKLYQPDKYSWVIAPTWWMISNTFFEPKLVRRGCTRKESALMFKIAMAENMKNGFQEQGHDIYLKQWGHYEDNGISGKH